MNMEVCRSAANERGEVLITGVGKRIGLYLAKQFMAQGRAVIGTYRREREGLNTLREQGATLYQCDFYDEQNLERLISQIRDHHPRLRAIIHNASDWVKEGQSPDQEVIERMMQVHVYAPYRLNLALAPLLQRGAAPMADIIHLTDYVAQTGSGKHIAYAASKAALENMTLSFAKKLSPQIKVNSIAPALICFNPEDDQAYQQKALSKVLLGKEGGEAEVWQAVQYLMSSQFITGRSLPLDGGRHLV